jgi:hypothetical protein
MTTAELLEKVQQVLAEDLDLIAWCLANCEAPPTVQIDFDEQQELPDTCYPFIGILSVTHDNRIHQRSNIWTLRLVAAVRNGELEQHTTALELPDGESYQVKTRTYPGRLLAEGLREQAVISLYKGRLGKVTQGSDDMSHTYHPKFYSPFTITIEERI